MGSQDIEFVDHIVNLYKAVPGYAYEALLSIFCVGLTLFFLTKGIKKGIRYSSALLLAEYVYLLYSTTVIYRIERPSRIFSVQLFYSYFNDYANHYLLIDNLMNVVVFIPIGLLMPICLQRILWWHILLFGCGLSLSIEILQYVLVRGNANVDDIMHNTLGCLIGYGIAHAIVMFLNREKHENR